MSSKRLTVVSLAHYIGKTVRIRMESLEIDVRIIDVKISYGQPRLVVMPLAGAGEQTIELSRLRKLEVARPKPASTDLVAEEIAQAPQDWWDR